MLIKSRIIMQKESFINHVRVIGFRGRTMKRIVAAVMLSLFLFSGMALAFYDGHVYRNGRVDSISPDIITISGEQYRIDSKCRVSIQDQEQIRSAYRGEISIGDIVTVKEIGKVIYEITVERWRR
jgi:hypothetical protein